MTTEEPTRLLDAASGASPALRGLLESAASDGPSAADLARLAGKLGPLLGGPPGGPGPDASGGAGTSSGGSAAPAAPAAAQGATAAGTTGAAGLFKAKVLLGIGATALAGASFQAGRAVESRARAVPPPLSAPVARAVPPPPVPDVLPPPEVPAEPAPAPAPPKAPVRPSSKTPPPALPAPTAMVAGEAPLLDQALRALRAGNTADALRFTELHRREFPQGTLSQEREMLAIEALVKLERRGDARLRAAAFRQAWPTSSHLLRLDSLVPKEGATP